MHDHLPVVLCGGLQLPEFHIADRHLGMARCRLDSQCLISLVNGACVGNGALIFAFDRMKSGPLAGDETALSIVHAAHAETLSSVPPDLYPVTSDQISSCSSALFQI